MRNAGLDEAQAGIRIAGRNINNLRYADDTTLMAEREPNSGEYLQDQSHHTMGSDLEPDLKYPVNFTG